MSYRRSTEVAGIDVHTLVELVNHESLAVCSGCKMQTRLLEVGPCIDVELERVEQNMREGHIASSNGYVKWCSRLQGWTGCAFDQDPDVIANATRYSHVHLLLLCLRDM